MLLSCAVAAGSNADRFQLEAAKEVPEDQLQQPREGTRTTADSGLLTQHAPYRPLVLLMTWSHDVTAKHVTSLPTLFHDCLPTVAQQAASCPIL